jgi:hypothetical protein
VSEPLPKPDHLRPIQPSSPLAWLGKRPAAVIALIAGVIAFAIVAIAQGEVWATPDWRVSVPGFTATALAALVSLARRERGYWLWGLGLALAAASLVLGWFLMVAIIIAAAAVLILILHALL